MDISQILLFAMSISIFLLVVVGIYIVRSERKDFRARQILIGHLSKDARFVEKIKNLRRGGMDELKYKAEIARTQALILEGLEELNASRAKTKEEPLTQRYLSGGTGYIEQFASDVLRTADDPTG